jgi:hypothetical protein
LLITIKEPINNNRDKDHHPSYHVGQTRLPKSTSSLSGFEHDTTQHSEIIRSAAAAQEMGESKKQIQPFDISFIHPGKRPSS